MWEAFCQYLRNCGRSGHLFTLVILLIGAGAYFGTMGILVILGLFAMYVVRICAEAYQQRDCFGRVGRQTLESVDLRVARVRLANSKTQRLQAEQARRLKTQRVSGLASSRKIAGAGPLRLRRGNSC